MKSCYDCIFMETYSKDTNHDEKIKICVGDGFEEGDDGEYNLVEVSEFDPRDCYLFKKKRRDAILS